MKIKIHWGTGLAIGMVIFISFIMYFVITMLSSTDYDHDLVVEDYYKAELHYQEDIDAQRNLLALSRGVDVYKKDGRLMLNLPEEMELSKMKGSVTLYRPSNKKLDFDIPLQDLVEKTIEISSKKLIPGRWNVIVSWVYEGEEYLFKKEILY
ncbi:FixH family protein [Christiangramia sp.]|uniref:FixH family protein n=1 Tax=Christiangramia sp. TaxID=1931228 RepID=UPI0026045540|nr:FixH family protein [Christiangramia sp.]